MTTTTATDDRKPIPATPPRDWELEIPRYKVVREMHPSPKPRHRLEPPFSTTTDSDMYQYATREMKAGEIVETREWPHASFFPLNIVAKRIINYFNSRQKSRLARSPYDARGQLQLQDGLTGGLPKIVAPKVAPVGRDAWPDL